MLSSLRLSNHLAYTDQNQFILEKLYATKSVYMYSELQIDKKKMKLHSELHIRRLCCFFVVVNRSIQAYCKCKRKLCFLYMQQ
jgi:hypothetical protein